MHCPRSPGSYDDGSMTTELAKGQNIPLPATDLVLTLTAPGLTAHAVLVDAAGRIRSAAEILGPGLGQAAGISLQGQHLSVQLDHVAPVVERIHLVAAGPATGLTLQSEVHSGGVSLASFRCAGLTVERAVQVLEIYRRGGVWKVRAIGQGYAGGLRELLLANGAAAELAAGAERQLAAPARQPAPASGPAPVTAGDRPADPYAITDAERQTRELRGIFQDAARSTAGYREAIDFAESRRDRDLEALVGDPQARTADHPGRQAALARYDELVMRATTNHQRDMDQLRREVAGLEQSLVPALAGWGSSAWRSPAPGTGWQETIRIGEVTIAEAPGLRIPLVTTTLTRRAMWLGCQVVDESAVQAALGLCLRTMAAAPQGAVRIRLVDPYGGLSRRLSGLAGIGVAPTTGPDVLGGVLRDLAARVDLVNMARQAGAADSLPTEVATTSVLLVLVGVYPEAGPDLRTLRTLIDEGGRAGIGVLLVDDPRKATEADLRMMVVPADSTGVLVDGWVGLEWEYHPDPGPADPTWTADTLRRFVG